MGFKASIYKDSSGTNVFAVDNKLLCVSDSNLRAIQTKLMNPHGNITEQDRYVLAELIDGVCNLPKGECREGAPDATGT